MKRYFKNRFGQLIELDINHYYLNGELKRVNIYLIKSGKTQFLHTLFFSKQVVLDSYQLVELGDFSSDYQQPDAFSEHPFYLFCSPVEIEDFQNFYPRVMILCEDRTIVNFGLFA